MRFKKQDFRRDCPRRQVETSGLQEQVSRLSELSGSLGYHYFLDHEANSMIRGTVGDPRVLDRDRSSCLGVLLCEASSAVVMQARFALQ